MTTLATTSFGAIGTTATLVAPEGARDTALAVLEEELAAIDLACSRFRDDSELQAVNRAGGRPCAVSELFLDSLEAALRAARLTGGLVVPTVGRALRLLGYDRDFALLEPDGPPVTMLVEAVPGWSAIEVDRASRRVTVPAGVELDFGATAKALCADRAARRAADATGCGVLVSLGGDVAVAGTAPEEGWPVGVADDHASPLDSARAVVVIRSGGLATSSTWVRRWRRGGRELHHLVDPRRGVPAEERWTTVTVAAGSCLDANVAACASILLGDAAPAWLEARHLPARLAGRGGAVITTGGWPQ